LRNCFGTTRSKNIRLEFKREVGKDETLKKL
jgi:hypothetical protein